MANSNDQNTSNSDATSREQVQVTVLPPEERENFKGLTIDTGGTGKQEDNNQGYSEYEYRDPYKRVYVRRVKLNNPVWNWLIFGLLALIVVFIVLPVFSFLFFPIIIPMFLFILVSNLFRRR